MSDNLGRQQRLCLPKSAPRPDPRSFAQSSPEIRDLRLRQIATLKRLTGFATSRIVPRIYKDSTFGYDDKDVCEELNEGAIRLIEHFGRDLVRTETYLKRAIEERAAGREGVTIIAEDFDKACQLLDYEHIHDEGYLECLDDQDKEASAAAQRAYQRGCQDTLNRVKEVFEENGVDVDPIVWNSIQAGLEADFTGTAPDSVEDGQDMDVDEPAQCSSSDAQKESSPSGSSFKSSNGSRVCSDHAMSDASTVTSSPELPPAPAAAAHPVPDLSLSDAATTTSTATPTKGLRYTPGRSRKNKRGADQMDVDETWHYGGDKRARK